MARFGAPSPHKSGLYIGPQTFMNVAYSTNFSDAKAAILGVPYDGGVHPTRIGSRTGPASIREHSQLVRPFQPPHATFNPLELLSLVDCGDADTTPSIIEDSFKEIQDAATGIYAADASPLALGGDGNRDYMRYNVATTFTRAAEEGLLDVPASIHIGPRGPTNDIGVFEHTREVGYQLIDGRELFETGLRIAAHRIVKDLQGRDVYLCFDMDFFDPSCAPGVCTPTWGGATAREGLSFLQNLSGLNIIGADINTVSPPHDTAGMTAFLAGTVALEILTLFCHAKKLL